MTIALLLGNFRSNVSGISNFQNVVKVDLTKRSTRDHYDLDGDDMTSVLQLDGEKEPEELNYSVLRNY